jgi:hypothetical protein
VLVLGYIISVTMWLFNIAMVYHIVDRCIHIDTKKTTRSVISTPISVISVISILLPSDPKPEIRWRLQHGPRGRIQGGQIPGIAENSTTAFRRVITIPWRKKTHWKAMGKAMGKAIYGNG